MAAKNKQINDDQPGLNELITLSDAAEKSGFTTRHLRYLAENGELWAKTVQLDLEAKKMLVREDVKPLRWHRTG